MSSSHPLWDNLKDSCFPQLYQAHHREYIEDIPFWLDLARMQGDPILELGCGPGRVLIQLANAGYTCYGIDNDSGMLLQLKNESISGGKGKIYSVLADMTSFQFQKQFPLIIGLYSPSSIRWWGFCS